MKYLKFLIVIGVLLVSLQSDATNQCYNLTTNSWIQGCTLSANQVLISDDGFNAGFYGPIFKNIDFQMQNVEPDVALCVNPSSYTLPSGAIVQALTCSSTSGKLFGHVAMPNGYTGGAVYFRPYMINDNPSPTGTYTTSFSCMCVGDGESVSTTAYGTPQTASITFTGAQHSQFDKKTSVVTCGGSCNGGEQLYWKMTIPAIAQAASAKFISISLIYPWNPHGDN